MAKQLQLMTLRVELDDITPAIWRSIEVDGDITLRGLHHTSRLPLAGLAPTCTSS